MNQAFDLGGKMNCFPSPVNRTHVSVRKVMETDGTSCLSFLDRFNARAQKGGGIHSLRLYKPTFLWQLHKRQHVVGIERTIEYSKGIIKWSHDNQLPCGQC